MPKAVITITGTCESMRRMICSISKPGHARQLEIGQDQIGAIDQRQGFFGFRCFLHLEAGIQQLQFENAAQLVFVFDDQDLVFS